MLRTRILHRRNSAVLLAAFVFGLLPGSGIAGSEGRYETWQASRPFTLGVMYYDLVYGPHWYDPAAPDRTNDPDMGLFQEAGLNLLVDVSMSAGGHEWYPGLRAAQAAGMPFMTLGAGWAGLEGFQHRVKWFAGDKNFFGVQLADEPYDPEDQKTFAGEGEWLRETYPHLLSLFCTPITDQPKWAEQWAAIKSDAIIFQWYPYHTSSGKSPHIIPEMYACLGYCSTFCKERGIGFFLARSTGGQARSDSALRINTYAALACGADGFLDWKWGTTSPESGYVWYKNKEPQGPAAHFEHLARINREVANLGPALSRLRHIRTYHLNLPSRNTWAGPIHGFGETDGLRTGKLEAVEGRCYPYHDNLMIGFFRDENEDEYFMVVNKNNTRCLDLDEEVLTQEVVLTFQDDVPSVERLSRDTGEVEQLALEDHRFTFRLSAGTGDLFKYSNGRSFVGADPGAG